MAAGERPRDSRSFQRLPSPCPSHGCELVAAAVVCRASRGQQANHHLLHMHCSASTLYSAIASSRQPARCQQLAGKLIYSVTLCTTTNSSPAHSTGGCCPLDLHRSGRQSRGSPPETCTCHVVGFQQSRHRVGNGQDDELVHYMHAGAPPLWQPAFHTTCKMPAHLRTPQGRPADPSAAASYQIPQKGQHTTCSRCCARCCCRSAAWGGRRARC